MYARDNKYVFPKWYKKRSNLNGRMKNVIKTYFNFFICLEKMQIFRKHTFYLTRVAQKDSRMTTYIFPIDNRH